MPLRGNHGPAIWRALEQAWAKFGRPNAHNQEQIAQWVQSRVKVLTGEAEPEPRDGKAAQVGDSE